MPDLSAAFEGSSMEEAALLLRLVYCPEEACGSSFSGEGAHMAASSCEGGGWGWGSGRARAGPRCGLLGRLPWHAAQRLASQPCRLRPTLRPSLDRPRPAPGLQRWRLLGGWRVWPGWRTSWTRPACCAAWSATSQVSPILVSCCCIPS